MDSNSLNLDKSPDLDPQHLFYDIMCVFRSLAIGGDDGYAGGGL